MNKRVFAAIGLIAAVLVTLFAGFHLGVFERSQPVRIDFSYEGHRFGDPGSVIDLGIQPLWLPGVISEVMRRDTILHEALAEHGFEIRFHPFLKGADVNTFIASRHLEAGIGGDMPALTACGRFLITVTSLIDRSFSSIVAATPTRTIDLRGKRIGYGFGSNAHRMLLETLSEVGLGIDDVHLVAIDVNEMPEALTGGVVDAFAAWEPTPTTTLARNPSAGVVSLDIATGYLYFERGFAERYPVIVRDIVASQIRSMTWLKRGHSHLMAASRWTVEAGRELLGDRSPPPAEQWAAAANAGLLGTETSAALPEEDMQDGGPLHRSFLFLQELGLISKGARWLDVATCFDPTVVAEVVSDGTAYRLTADGFVVGYEE